MPAGLLAFQYTLLLRSGGQRDRADAGRDVKTTIAFNAERLKSDRLVETADQNVRAKTNADRGRGRGTGIVALQGARTDVRRRGKHAPDEHAAIGVTDVDTELGNRAGVMLTAMAVRVVGAVQVLRGTEHKAPAARNVASQRADLDAVRRSVGGTRKRERANSNSGTHHQANILHFGDSPSFVPRMAHSKGVGIPRLPLVETAILLKGSHFLRE